MYIVRASWQASLFVLVAAVGACGQTPGGGANEQRSAAATPASQAASTQGLRRAPIVLEFDVPAEFTTMPAGSASAVTGFRVGIFQADSTSPLSTMDFARDAITVQGGTARVTLAPERIPEGIENGFLRVQTLSRGQAGPWSDPVALGGAVPRRTARQASPRPPRPAQPRVAVINPAGAAPGQRRRGLTPADIENYAALSAALRKVLPADATLEMELGRFRRLQDVAVAVVISRDHEIPFTTVSNTMAGPPRLVGRNALAKLRPDLTDPLVFRKVRAEALRLIEVPGGAAPKP
jgi:hypothetical protein